MLMNDLINTIIFAWITVTFLISGLCINILQLLVLPLFWIHRYLYHSIILRLAYAIYSPLVFLAEWWCELDLKIYGDQHVKERFANNKFIFIINHYGDLDWMIGWVISERLGNLGGTRVFSKDASKYFPIMGWCWWFAEYGFLTRHWSKDEQRLLKMNENLKNNKVAHSVSLLCEGTRRTVEKLQRSNEYATKEGRKPLKHHLQPRTKGFSYLVNGLADEGYEIYDVEITFPNVENATFLNVIKRKKIEAATHVRKVEVSKDSINTIEGATELCYKIYQQKDETMEYFIQHGKFPGDVVDLPRRPHSLLMVLYHNIFTTIVLNILFSYCMATFGLNVTLLFTLFIFISVIVLLLVTDRYTQTNRGSSFDKKVR